MPYHSVYNLTLLSYLQDNNIKVWDLEAGKCVTTYKGHSDRVMCLQFDTNKIGFSSLLLLLFLTSLRCFIFIFFVKKNVNSQKIHTHSICPSIYLSIYLLVSGSVDKTIRIWDMRTKPEIPAIVLKGHNSCVYDLHFDDFKIGKTKNKTKQKTKQRPPLTQ